MFPPGINSEEEAPHSLLQDEEGDDELADLLPSKRKKKKDSQSGSIRGILEVLKEVKCQCSCYWRY